MSALISSSLCKRKKSLNHQTHRLNVCQVILLVSLYKLHREHRLEGIGTPVSVQYYEEHSIKFYKNAVSIDDVRRDLECLLKEQRRFLFVKIMNILTGNELSHIHSLISIIKIQSYRTFSSVMSFNNGIMTLTWDVWETVLTAYATHVAGCRLIFGD